MYPEERRERAWEVESADEFLSRVQALVTEETDPLQRSQNLHDLRLAYETRAQFFVELEDHLGEGTLGKQVPMPERGDLEQLLADVTDEYMAAETNDPSFISLDILNQLDDEG
jgi:hypothetical protein